MTLFFNRNKFKKPVSVRSDPAYMIPHGCLVILVQPFRLSLTAVDDDGQLSPVPVDIKDYNVYTYKYDIKSNMDGVR